MHNLTDDTALILVPGLRPPVPPRPDRLGNRRPAAGLIRRIAGTADLAVAGVLITTGLAAAVAIATPAGVLVGCWFAGQAYLALTPPAVEVPRV